MRRLLGGGGALQGMMMRICFCGQHQVRCNQSFRPDHRGPVGSEQHPARQSIGGESDVSR